MMTCFFVATKSQYGFGMNPGVLLCTSAQHPSRASAQPFFRVLDDPDLKKTLSGNFLKSGPSKTQTNGSDGAVHHTAQQAPRFGLGPV